MNFDLILFSPMILGFYLTSSRFFLDFFSSMCLGFYFTSSSVLIFGRGKQKTPLIFESHDGPIKRKETVCTMHHPHWKAPPGPRAFHDHWNFVNFLLIYNHFLNSKK